MVMMMIDVWSMIFLKLEMVENIRHNQMLERDPYFFLNIWACIWRAISDDFWTREEKTFAKLSSGIIGKYNNTPTRYCLDTRTL